MTQPVAVYAMRVPPGDIMVPAVPNAAAMFRLTMAAIDPTEEHIVEGDKRPLSTLKLVRVPEEMLDEDSEDEDDEEDDEDDEEDSALVNGESSKDAEMEDDEDSSDEEAAAQELLKELMKGKKGKGKAPAGLEEDEDDDDDEDEDDLDSDIGMSETVLCTLDPEKQYQQPLDFTVAEGERVFFRVTGTHTVHLTGNYVMPLDEPADEDDDEEDMMGDAYDEDELDELDALVNGEGSESDELDDLEDPRVMEVDDEIEAAVSKLTEPKNKNKNKRAAPDTDNDDSTLDNIMAKSLKADEKAGAADEAPVADKKLTKAEKKAAKKAKANDGTAVTTAEVQKEASAANGTTDDKKKVQFAKNLEQGPTPSKADAGKKGAAAPAEAGKKSTSLKVETLPSGLVVDDRKIGAAPMAKKGSRLEMRYIGKLDDGKVFDSNKSGKPFSFKLGTGEVIKGWDEGLKGIGVGGERRLIIPAALAYGKKALPGIPANSKLTFDIKCLSVK